MATTKRIKSVGKDAAEAELTYLRKAALMTPYEVDIYERLIYVPETELDAAAEDMIISHLCTGYKFHIQSCIPTETTKKELFSPQMSNRVLVPKQAEIKRFNEGDMFKGTSTGTILKIVRTEKHEVELAYVEYDERIGAKQNLIVSPQQLETNLRREILKPFTP